MRRISTLVIVAAVVGLGVWGYFYAQSRGASPKYRTAQVEKGKADIENARAALAEAKANTAKAQVTVLDSNRDLERKTELFKRELIAKSDLDSAQATYDSAVALLEAAKAKEQSLNAA